MVLYSKINSKGQHDARNAAYLLIFRHLPHKHFSNTSICIFHLCAPQN
jgi:hypothetical protein